MAFIHKLIPFIALVIVFGPQYSYAVCDQNVNTDIQKIIDADRVRYHIPGIEVSIICPGEQTPRNFVSGTVIVDSHKPIREQHLFQIGSETKSFIATLIMQLEAEGALSIQDPISDYLPLLPEEWHNITIQQMLNHSSGIYNYTDVMEEQMKDDVNYLNQAWTSEELINLVTSKPLYFKAGEGFHYSNTNYVLAGLIIEKVTHHSLALEIKNRLTVPLNLANTYYLPSSYDHSTLLQMAHGYAERGTYPHEPTDITETNHSWANAAGAMVSTSHDMAIWFQHLIQGQLFPQEQMREFTALIQGSLPNTSTPIGYGLGVIHDYDVFGEEAWWHSGGTFGFAALMIWLKSSDVIITVNINHATKNRDVYALSKDLAQRLQEPHPR